MTRVTITGWREGLNKVQLNHLLRQHAGYGLGEAKRAVDELLAGESLTIESPDPESASAFCGSANAIGAVCCTAPAAHQSSEANGQVVQSAGGASDQSVRELAQVFKLLGDETRLRILFYLALSPKGELHVTDLCQRLGQSQPAVSHHLALLRVSGLIESRREGKHNFYCVRTEHFGKLLLSLFSAAGEVPRNKKYRFHDFVLSYSGA